MLAAAGLKIASPDAYLTALRHAVDPVFTLSPTGLVCLATVILTVEATLGALLLVHPVAFARFATAGLLVIFSGVLVLRFTQPGAPSCGCFGEFLTQSRASQAWIDAARNLFLALALLLVVTPRPRVRIEPPPAPSRAPMPSARAFTLLELLVTIALIGVLLALVFPALQAVRDRALLIRSFAQLRQVYVATNAYTEANRDTFPRFEAIGDSYDPIRHRGLTIPYGGYFGAHQTLWMALVAPDDTAFHAMAADRPHHERVEQLDDTEDRRFIRYYDSRFWMSPTLVADPSVFDEPISTQRRIEGPALLRGVRTFEISHPSRKGLFIDVKLMFSKRPVPPPGSPISPTPNPLDYKVPDTIAVFADASTGTIPHFDALAQDRFIFVAGGRIFTNPVTSTRHGVRGVDR
jgi:prepilin-type N-terminal cleavage/methylation domain-containing protein